MTLKNSGLSCSTIFIQDTRKIAQYFLSCERGFSVYGAPSCFRLLPNNFFSFVTELTMSEMGSEWPIENAAPDGNSHNDVVTARSLIVRTSVNPATLSLHAGFVSRRSLVGDYSSSFKRLDPSHPYSAPGGASQGVVLVFFFGKCVPTNLIL